MARVSATRRLEFDAGHRVMRHESRCAHLHGHRYRVDVTCSADALDDVGRGVDFGVVKADVGGWIDEVLDHALLLHPDDPMVAPAVALQQGGVAGPRQLPTVGGGCWWPSARVVAMPDDLGEPTAENLATLVARLAVATLGPRGLVVDRVRVYETPNCWADWRRDATGG